MKTTMIALAALAIASAGPAYAAPHHRALQCGFPHPDPGCRAPVVPPVHVTPSPVVAPTNATPKDIFSGLLTFQADVVANLQQADTYEAAPINAATGMAWNPTAHQCLTGMPGQGTAGQPGYVAPSQGLIAWVQGLAPLAASTIPPLPGPTSAVCLADQAATPNPASTPLDCANPSPATIAVYADNQFGAAEGTVQSLLNQITSGGVPSDLKLSCGAMINHVGDQIITATNQVAAFELLLAKYVMPLVAMGGAHHAPVPTEALPLPSRPIGDPAKQ
jgi:hypothetical protein